MTIDQGNMLVNGWDGPEENTNVEVNERFKDDVLGVTYKVQDVDGEMVYMIVDDEDNDEIKATAFTKRDLFNNFTKI